MRDRFEPKRRRGPSRLKLVDDALARRLRELGFVALAFLNRLSAFLHRFRVRGLKRVGVELLGEATTLALGGGILLLALAKPAMVATKGDWRAEEAYAVTFLDRNGAEIGKRGLLRSDIIPLAELPDILVKATLATEDRRFFQHFGIDVLGTFRAFLADLQKSAVVQGGSSITQQLAKNIFLTNERTIQRKIKEAFLALWLESNLSKAEILELYLNRAYMGGGTFGVEAASQFYFGKPVKQVTLPEAAMLAGLFKAPARYAPHINLAAARARANEVLSNLVEAGFMTEGQVIGARRNPAAPVPRPESTSPDYFLDWAFGEVKAAVPEKGDHVLTVKTTIDMEIQRAAEQALESALRKDGARYNVRQGAIVVVEVDGAVRAMVGGRDYGDSQFNRATQALRQPGSSFKPFVYTAAMMNGFTPKSVVQDAPITIGDWSPHNFGGGYSGPVTLLTAITKSLNTVAVRLAQAVGRDKIIDLAHRMGITTELLATRSLPLGSSEVIVADMASAYATFASGGFRQPQYAFTTIVNSSGERVYDRGRDAPAPKRVLEDRIVADMNGMLSQVPIIGTAVRAKLDGIPTAGKTGTASDYRDAWFVGFTGNFVGAVWFGNDDYRPMKAMTGGTLPAETWKVVMTVAHAKADLRPIPFVAEQPVKRPPPPAQAVASGKPLPPAMLTAHSAAVLAEIEQFLRSAPALPGETARRPGALPEERAAAPAPRTAAALP
ncbi:MAG: PBP1A family penicillin-binding protein [Bauldia sp.]